jgi:uncharacterized protein YndB with AHSA1/START domain
MSNSKLIPLNFSITINAPVETVWHKMLDLETYKIWTVEFDATSYYKGSWDLGQTILFKSTEREGGIAGEITEYEYLKVVKITYLGWLLPDDSIDTESYSSKNAKGAVEKYTFTKVSDKVTKLDVFLESEDIFDQYMKEQWPKALKKLKEMCE